MTTLHWVPSLREQQENLDHIYAEGNFSFLYFSFLHHGSLNMKLYGGCVCVWSSECKLVVCVWESLCLVLQVCWCVYMCVCVILVGEGGVVPLQLLLSACPLLVLRLCALLVFAAFWLSARDVIFLLSVLALLLLFLLLAAVLVLVRLH